jgi:hypothetical protein
MEERHNSCDTLVSHAMEQKTGIGSLYAEFFRGYGAEIRLSCPDPRPNSTYKRTSTLKSLNSAEVVTGPTCQAPLGVGGT